MAKCKTAVIPFLVHWSYCNFTLSHEYCEGQREPSVYDSGPCFNIKTVFLGLGISIIKIRWS